MSGNIIFTIPIDLDMAVKEVLGIDFGGSGIKGAPVNTKTGELLAPRHRIETPSVSTPEAVAKVISQIVGHFNWEGPVGVGFPSVVLNGEIKTASNIDDSWIGVNAMMLLQKQTGLPFCVVNDADAAGYAEMKFGAGANEKGTVLLITVGTGIGTVIFSDKALVANTELGHVYLDNGREGEDFSADSVRQREDLSWDDWGSRFNKYLNEMHKLFWPELIIIGGGVSKKPEKFMSQIHVPTKIVMAKLKNEAGLIGAALAAKKYVKGLKK